MDICLINPAGWGSHVQPPRGMACLAGVAEAAGIETSVFDLNALVYKSLVESEALPGLAARLGLSSPGQLWADEGRSNWYGFPAKRLYRELSSLLDSFWQRLEQITPRVIGMSIHGPDLMFAICLAGEIRKRLPETKLIAGGPWFPLDMNRYVLRTAPFDAVVLGEGEEVLVPLAWSLVENREFEAPGCRVEQVGKVPFLWSSPIDLSAQPLPSYEAFDLSLYKSGCFVTQISLGCPGTCKFCSQRKVTEFYSRPAEKVIEELAMLYDRHGLQEILFLDSGVNWTPAILSSVCQWMVDKKWNVTWSANGLFTDRLTEDQLSLMSAAGCRHLVFGLKSGSERLRGLMGKRFTNQTASRVMQQATDAGIDVGVNLIIGYLDEQQEDIEKTKRFLSDNRPNIEKVILIFPLMIDYPATVWEERGSLEFCDMKNYSQTWIKGDNTPWQRLSRLEELANHCDEIALPVLSTNTFSGFMQREPSRSKGLLGTKGKWSLAGGRLHLFYENELVVGTDGLFFDWDEGGQRSFSYNYTWIKQDGRFVLELGPGMAWELTPIQNGEGVSVEIAFVTSALVEFQRFKVSLVFTEKYDCWTVGESSGRFPEFDFLAQEWAVDGPKDANGVEPFDESFQWVGEKGWIISGNEEAVPISLDIEGKGCLPVAQRHCECGGGVGYYFPSGLSLSVGRHEICRLNLSFPKSCTN